MENRCNRPNFHFLFEAKNAKQDSCHLGVVPVLHDDLGAPGGLAAVSSDSGVSWDHGLLHASQPLSEPVPGFGTSSPFFIKTWLLFARASSCTDHPQPLGL